MGKGSGGCLPTKSLKFKLRLAQGKQNSKEMCPKGKLEFIYFFFFETCTGLTIASGQ